MIALAAGSSFLMFATTEKCFEDADRRNATVLVADHKPGGLPPVALLGAKLNLLNDPVPLLKIDAQCIVAPGATGPRPVEGGLEVFEVPLPCVITAQKGMNEPRYPTLKGIMGAKKKEIKELKAGDLQASGLGTPAPALEVVALEALPPRPPGRVLTGDPKDMARELVRALREDAKAI